MGLRTGNNLRRPGSTNGGRGSAGDRTGPALGPGGSERGAQGVTQGRAWSCGIGTSSWNERCRAVKRSPPGSWSAGMGARARSTERLAHRGCPRACGDDGRLGDAVFAAVGLPPRVRG